MKKTEYRPFESAQANQDRSNSDLIFLNFSLPAIITCNHSDYCKDICYAYINEKRYPFSSSGGSTERKRYANLYFTLDFNDEDFVEFIGKETREIKKNESVLSPYEVLNELKNYYIFPKKIICIEYETRD